MIKSGDENLNCKKPIQKIDQATVKNSSQMKEKKIQKVVQWFTYYGFIIKRLYFEINKKSV